MGAIAGSIPNIIGGVSQQPVDIRPINTAKLLNNVWLSPAIGMVTRPNTAYIGKYDNATITSDTFVAQHSIQKSSGNFQVNVIDGAIRVMDTDSGVEQTIFLSDPSVLDYLTHGSDSNDIGFVTVADTTFIYNKSKVVEATVTGESGTSGNTEDGLARRSPYRYGTVWVRQRLAGLNYYSVYINGTQRADELTDVNAPSIIAGDLMSTLNGGSSVDGVSRQGGRSSILFITFNNDDDWVSVAGGTSGSSDAMVAVNDKVSEFADLPRSDRVGRLIRIDQSEDEFADDYWVWYNNGFWEETYGWGAKETLDVDTMPLKLVDNKDGSFTLSEVDWGGRTVGDVDSNPTPTFVGKTINNMFIYKGRMCIQSGENFIASQVSDFENFYRSTCTQLVDDDPIDIASPESRGAPLVHAQEFNNSLLMFSAFDQFTIKGDSDGLLSPNTVQIEYQNSYNCAKNVTPVQAGPNVIFADDFGNRNFASLREYQVERVFGQQVALSLTDSVPEYIPKGVYKIANSSTDNIILMATEGDRRSLYAYHYYYNNDGKVQAAWNKWTFGGDIYNIDFQGDKLLMTMLFEGELIVTGMTFHLNVNEEINNNSILLDERLASENVTTVFDGTDTTVTLPIDADDNVILVVAFDDTSDLFPLGREIVPNSITDDELVFEGVDLTGVEFYLGNPIETQWDLNPLYYRDDKQVPIQDGRVQLRSISFLFSNSAFFTVTITAPNRDPVVNTFSGYRIGSPNDILNSVNLDDGEFRVPAYGESDIVEISVKSRSPWRVRFTSVEWDAAYRAKRRRVS